MSTTEEPLILEAIDRDERLSAGKLLRTDSKRSTHGSLPDRPDDFDLITTLQQSNEDRLPSLVPIRYFRMASSPFLFYRGTANIMARDLARTPVSGINVQLSGDAHCANFGAFATPERNLIFDVRDFDETLRGPWEWDVKRLAASLVLASRDTGGDLEAQEEAVRSAICSYRKRTREFSEMSTLDVWYARVNVEEILGGVGSNVIRKQRRTYIDGIGRRTIGKAFDDMTETTSSGARRFVDEAPLVYHDVPEDAFFQIDDILQGYRESLSFDIRLLFDRYRMVDWVVKVVGVGSVGTRCAAVLFLASKNDPLMLQVKEAGASVLEEFVVNDNRLSHGERVVSGQRIMQAASDIFLGWTQCNGRSYYVRQLRDMKGVPDLEDMGDDQLAEFAQFCGRTLAGSHARSGHAANIAGYLGRGKTFDDAGVDFALAYADRAEADHRELVTAIESGILQAKADKDAGS